MSKSDNPPLFCCEVIPDRGAVSVYTDITLRDLFAAFALAGQEASSVEKMGYEDAAESAYNSADALLKEREKEKS